MRRSASERSCRPGRGEASLTSRFPAHGNDTASTVPADSLPLGKKTESPEPPHPIPLPSRSRMFPTSATVELAELGNTRVRRERESLADRALLHLQKTDCVTLAPPSPQRGEGWGEGVRALRNVTLGLAAARPRTRW